MIRPWTERDRTLTMFDELRRRMDNVFEDLGPWIGRHTPFAATLFDNSWPPVNIYDAGKKLVIAAELPGLKVGDVTLALDQNVLTISGERPAKVPKDYAVHRQERRGYQFKRSFTLPCDVDAERATAQLDDGVLMVSIEKDVRAQPRTISIKGS